LGWKRIEEKQKAIEIVIDLSPRVARKWIDRTINKYGEEAFLNSVSKRAKYEFLLGKVVEEGYTGIFPKEILWEGSSLAWETDYQVVITSPKGEVQITPATLVICRFPK